MASSAGRELSAKAASTRRMRSSVGIGLVVLSQLEVDKGEHLSQLVEEAVREKLFGPGATCHPWGQGGRHGGRPPLIRRDPGRGAACGADVSCAGPHTSSSRFNGSVMKRHDDAPGWRQRGDRLAVTLGDPHESLTARRAYASVPRLGVRRIGDETP